MNYKVYTREERPELLEQKELLIEKAWPKFMTEDPILNEHWHHLGEAYPDYQFYLVDPDTDKIIVAGNCMPLPSELVTNPMPSGGIDWMFEQLDKTATTSFDNKTLFAIQVVVEPALLGQGLSTEGIKAMSDIGRRHGCKDLYAPVRPNHKSKYPLMSMESYVNWKREDGLYYDPWMRVHQKLGAGLINVCEKSMTMPGTISQWEEWTDLSFPESGQYVIGGGLVPLLIDKEHDSGLYVEPNVWMRHRL